MTSHDHGNCSACDLQDAEIALLQAALTEAQAELSYRVNSSQAWAVRAIDLDARNDALQQRVETLALYRKFWEAFWDALVEQEFGYIEMDCEQLVTEKAVGLGLVEAVPYDPEKHEARIIGDPEKGDMIYFKAALRE